MFYANFVLAKKGPLARIWLAAHWEKKLSKAHVFETDLQSSVESIISPKVKIALRTSGHLLLGVVRIYSRKAKYLLADCTEALIKIKMAFRPGTVDLPEESREASTAAITLPELQEWDAIVNDLNNFDLYAQSSLNQCRVEEITMKEDLISANFIVDDNMFGDTSFGESGDKEILRDGSALDESALPPSETSKITIDEDHHKSLGNSKALALDEPLADDGFGGNGMDFLDGFGEGVGLVPDLDELPPDENAMPDITLDPLDITLPTKVVETKHAQEAEPSPEPLAQDIGNDTTLLHGDQEAFALEPIEIEVGKNKKRKRKRKLIVDDEKILSGDFIRSQIANTADIVQDIMYAPATKIRMAMEERSSVKMLFASPAIHLYCPHLLEAFTRNLTKELSRETDEASRGDVSVEEEIELPRAEIDDNQKDVSTLPADDAMYEMPVPVGMDDEPLPMETDGPCNEALPPMDNDTVANGTVDEVTLEPLPEIDSSAAEGVADLEGDAEGDALDEKRWTKRTQQTLHALSREFKTSKSVSFKRFSRNNNAKLAAYKFYTCLILNKENAIVVRQEKAYSDIFVSKGPRFADL